MRKKGRKKERTQERRISTSRGISNKTQGENEETTRDILTAARAVHRKNSSRLPRNEKRRKKQTKQEERETRKEEEREMDVKRTEFGGE